VGNAGVPMEKGNLDDRIKPNRARGNCVVNTINTTIKAVRYYYLSYIGTPSLDTFLYKHRYNLIL